jgi:hypothetical protein
VIAAARFELHESSPTKKDQWFSTFLKLNRDEQVLLMIGIVNYATRLGCISKPVDSSLDEHIRAYVASISWPMAASPYYYSNLMYSILGGFHVLVQLLLVEREKYLDHFAETASDS